VPDVNQMSRAKYFPLAHVFHIASVSDEIM